MLASASKDTTIRLWDAISGRLVYTLRGHTRETTAVAFSPDGKTLASGSWDNTVRFWKVAKGTEIRLLRQGGGVLGVAWSPDGRTLISSGSEIQLWEAASGTEVKIMEDRGIGTNVVWGPEGRWVASGVQADGVAKAVGLWDVANGRLLQVLKGHQFVVQSVALSPDGKTLASSDDGGTIRLWDVSGLKRLERPIKAVVSQRAQP
jgi:WD40 repeat protein